MKHYIMAVLLLTVMVIIGNTTNGVDGVVQMMIGYIAIMIGILTVTAVYIMTWCVFHKEIDGMEEKENGVE